MLAQEAEAPRDDAAPPVGPDGDPGANGRGPRPRSRPRPPRPCRLSRTRPVTRAPSRTSTPASRAASRSAASRARRRTRETRQVPAPVLAPERRAVGRHELHAAQGVGREGAHPIGGAHGVQEPPGLGGDALAADLVAGEPRGVEEEHVVPALARGSRPRPTPAGPPPATTTSRRSVAHASSRRARRPGDGRGTAGATVTLGIPARANAAAQLVGAEAAADRQRGRRRRSPGYGTGRGRPRGRRGRGPRAVQVVHDQRASGQRVQPGQDRRQLRLVEVVEEQGGGDDVEAPRPGTGGGARRRPRAGRPAGPRAGGAS